MSKATNKVKKLMANEIKKIGIVGAGQMGRGIAQVAAMSGYIVILYDVNEEGLSFGIEFIQKQLARGVEKEKWNQSDADAGFSALTASTDIEDLADCDLLIEAATENKKIILATNTSSISITEIAAATTRPEKVAGMHFMNPVPVMKLVEGIRGLETSNEVFDQVESVSLKMGKTFIKVNDVAGFAINRILMPMINEAVYAHYEGVASIEDIDIGMKLGTNQPMGPFELADSKYRPCPLLKKYVLAGRFGRKSARGFYEY